MNKSIKSTLKRYVEKYNVGCAYCSKKYTYMRRISADHLKPKWAGNDLSLDNIIICCTSCNSIKKKGMSIEEFIQTDPRIKTNIQTYLNKIKKIIINGESYYNSIRWLEQYIE